MNKDETLAQPEKEPLEYWTVAEGWVKIEEVREHFDSVGCGTIYKTAGEGRKPLYTAPPQREWVGLTGPEVDEAYRSVSDKEWAIGGLADARVFLCAIEAKLKEKNG